MLKEYIQSLCTLFDHPANRSDDRNKGSIPFLIQTLKDFKLQTALSVGTDEEKNKSSRSYFPLILQLECSIMIIMTLQKCMYDESLVSLQIRHGIIEILMEKMEWITGTLNTLNLKHEIKKEAPVPISDMTAPIKRRRINYGETVHVTIVFGVYRYLYLISILFCREHGIHYLF